MNHQRGTGVDKKKPECHLLKYDLTLESNAAYNTTYAQVVDVPSTNDDETLTMHLCLQYMTMCMYDA